MIAADAMALPHLVRPGRNGWLYRPGDVGELTARLAALLGDAALRRRMGAASRELVAEHAIGATLDRFEGIYREVDRPRPRRCGALPDSDAFGEGQQDARRAVPGVVLGAPPGGGGRRLERRVVGEGADARTKPRDVVGVDVGRGVRRRSRGTSGCR